VSEEVATICAMVSIGSAVFYRPKDKAVHAEAAHKNFSRGDVGDHVALLNVYAVRKGVIGEEGGGVN
jgi:pre-mRNA-splicing factor ATP-dependent RNA helicase DHX16